MNLPSSAVSFQDSVLSKFPLILQALSCEADGITPLVLYLTVKDDLRDISEFIEVLDCLFALGKINFDDEKEVLRCVS
jgi:hypothetical protein